MRRCRLQYLAHRCLSYSSCRIVDDALESFLVIGIHRQSEVGDDILYFLALIERQPTINAVRHCLLAKRILKHTALCIRAVQDSKIRIFAPFPTLDATNGIHHHLCLFKV